MLDHSMLARLSANLTVNLRYLRQRSELTQAILAKRSGVPRSTIANLEAGSGNPTLRVLARLSTALRVSMEELLGTPRGLGRHYPKGSLPIERRGTSRSVTVANLLPDPIPSMEISRTEFSPHAKLAGVPHRPGTRGNLYCERGRIDLVVAGERFSLATGDVCTFRGDQSHSYINPGDTVAIGIGVVTLTPL